MAKRPGGGFPWLVAMLACLLAASVSVSALPARDKGPARGGAAPSREELESKAEAAKRRLEQYQRRLRRTKARERGLEHNVSVLDEERTRLNQMLITNARQIQNSEASLTHIERRLGELAAQEELIRGSLASRHGKIAALLASMQRIGRHPPPVIITRRRDALKMVRSAMLLGSLYPQLKNQADELAAKLTEMVRVVANIRTERDRFAQEKAMLKSNRASIKRLMARKKARLAARKSQLASLRSAARLHKRSVASISELIEKLNRQIEKMSRLGQYEARLKAGRAGAAPRKKAFVNPGRVEPAVAFSRTKGVLPMPVSGERLRSFGQRDKFGSSSRGIVLRTRYGAQVTAPADGWVVYAGHFRSYGNLLILNAGGGYHILLAGMDRIDAALGQFVLAGEPVGVMKSRPGKVAGEDVGGDGGAEGLDGMSGKNSPSLYIEFRKKGRPINPDPWWDRKTRMAAKGKV